MAFGTSAGSGGLIAVCTVLPREFVRLPGLPEVAGRRWPLRDEFDWTFSPPLDSVSA